jgi:hypothetical protein
MLRNQLSATLGMHRVGSIARRGRRSGADFLALRIVAGYGAAVEHDLCADARLLVSCQLNLMPLKNLSNRELFFVSSFG